MIRLSLMAPSRQRRDTLRRRRNHFFHPRLQVLEDRLAPSVFAVNSFADTHAANLTTGTDASGHITRRLGYSLLKIKAGGTDVVTNEPAKHASAVERQTTVSSGGPRAGFAHLSKGELRMKNANLLVVSLAVLTPALVLSHTQGANNENQAEEEVLIRRQISLGEQAMNKHDAGALAAQLAEDVDHINAFGGWTKGREAIRKAWEGMFGTVWKDDLSTTTPEKIRFLKPDVAVVIARISHRRPTESLAMATLVMTKRGDQWQVVSFQATPVQKIPWEQK
jgi:uncharacterized protein (TIGR02246 family)